VFPDNFVCKEETEDGDIGYSYAKVVAAVFASRDTPSGSGNNRDGNVLFNSIRDV
jgi:hypothetical protein